MIIRSLIGRAQGGRIVLSNKNVFNPAGGQNSFAVSAGIRLDSDGRLFTGFSETTTTPNYVEIQDEWYSIHPATVGTRHEVRLDLSSGVLVSGTANTWLPLSSNREFKQSDTTSAPTNRSTSGTFTLRVRRIGVPTSEVSVPVTLSCQLSNIGGA